MVEERGEILTKQENILAKAVSEKRNLTSSEETEIRTLESEFQKLSALIGDNAHGIQNFSGLAFLDNGNSVALSGGRALDAEKKIRAYAPGEKISANFSADPDLNLGSFLKAVITKPVSDHEREAVQKALGSDGYSLPVHVAAELIDLMRAQNPIIQAGARTITIEGGEATKFVKINSDMTAEWLPELQQQDFSDSTFGAVTMGSHTVRAICEIAREVQQDSSNLAEALTTSFTGALNQALLTASFTGNGIAQPLGLTSQVTQEEGYTGDINWAAFVKAGKTLYDQNLPAEGRSHIMNPGVWESLALDADLQQRFQEPPAFIRDIPNYVSSGVPAGQAYSGDFSNVVYGMRLNITIEQFPGAGVRKYANVWLAAMRIDMQVFRPNALVRILSTDT